MIHLQSLTLRPFKETRFPFNLAIFQHLDELQFKTPITFFVGENGTGKSTLLEAIACAAESVTVGSESVKTDKSLARQRELGKHLKLVWTKRTRKGFFLRAEDFFGYAKQVNATRAEMEEEIKTVDKEYKGRSQLAVSLAKMPYAHELGDMKRRYGEEGLDARSHGEGFLKLFQGRFVPGGLYLLDEPEAPLSPIRQLGLISALKEMIAQDAQFIIATHSPILMAFPESTIYSFDEGQIKKVKYENLEHVTLTKEFLNDPKAFIERL